MILSRFLTVPLAKRFKQRKARRREILGQYTDYQYANYCSVC